MWIVNLFRAERRISDLEDIVRTLQADVEQAKLDWDNLYDSCRKLMGRVSKERARMEAAAPKEEPVATERQGGNGRLPTGGFLTERQKQIQQAILRSRQGA